MILGMLRNNTEAKLLLSLLLLRFLFCMIQRTWRKMKVTNAKKSEVPFSLSYFAAPIKCFLLAPTHPSAHSLDYQTNPVNSGHSFRRHELISHQRPQTCMCWLSSAAHWAQLLLLAYCLY